jgi:hypothetical protein
MVFTHSHCVPAAGGEGRRRALSPAGRRHHCRCVFLMTARAGEGGSTKALPSIFTLNLFNWSMRSCNPYWVCVRLYVFVSEVYRLCCSEVIGKYVTTSACIGQAEHSGRCIFMRSVGMRGCLFLKLVLGQPIHISRRRRGAAPDPARSLAEAEQRNQNQDGACWIAHESNGQLGNTSVAY